jgi:MazG family protein
MDFVKRLEKLMEKLRGPGGCPWDRRQTHKSLKPYLLEEAHETLEAIDSGDAEHLREELGDLLLQVVFHSQLAKEKNKFNLQQVAKTIGDKLVRRHPHVFGKSSRKIVDINRRWEELKRAEKPKRKSALDGLPQSLPALLRAQRMHEKITNHGAPEKPKGSKDLQRAWKNFQKGLRGTKVSREKATGEFLFHLAQFAQRENIHAEMALKKATSDFEKKYKKSEKKISQ